MASLESVRQKIIRAEHHRDSLIVEANRYFESKPCTVEPEEEPETGRIIMRVKYNNPIPPSIPLIIGDSLQNLRSSLDYLVWELVLAAGNQPTRQNMFPICDSSSVFQEQLSRHRLDGVSKDAATEIERLQPYNDRAEIKPLRVIEDLSVYNRHRRILLTVLAPHSARTEFTSSVSGKHIHVAESLPRHDAEVGVSPRPSRVGEIMEVEGKLLFHIAMDEGAAQDIEIGSCLRALSSYVTDFVIPKFERFFRR
jgi:hypothetical protein